MGLGTALPRGAAQECRELPECGRDSSARLMTPGHQRFIEDGAVEGLWWGRWSLSLCPQGGLSAAPSRAVSAVKNINLPEIPRNINIGDINIKVPNLSQFM